MFYFKDKLYEELRLVITSKHRKVCDEMSSNSSSLSLDEVNTWNVDALRLFCRKRNLKVSGNKVELVARVFAASEKGIPVQPSANKLITRTETDKAKLLISPDKTQIPDPLSLKDNWLRESDG